MGDECILAQQPLWASNQRLPAIFLIGPMGAGKTTIGRLLASALSRKFYDSDHYIKDNAGADIPWIFEIEGERGFRTRETRALMALTQKPDIVLATGGGAVMSEVNRALLARGFVVYLNASVEMQYLRTQKDKSRPLLNAQNPKAVLQALYDKRHPVYRAVADLEIATGMVYPRQMVQEILEHLSVIKDGY